MQKLHFNSMYSAESFDLHNINDPFTMPSRSKSTEHSQRFIRIEKTHNSTKIKENKS